jgi:hypothetical protein
MSVSTKRHVVSLVFGGSLGILIAEPLWGIRLMAGILALGSFFCYDYLLSTPSETGKQ